MEQLFYIMDVKLQEYVNLIYPIVSTPINGQYCALTSPSLDDSVHMTVYVSPYIGETTGFTIGSVFTYNDQTYTKTVTQYNDVTKDPWLRLQCPVEN